MKTVEYMERLKQKLGVESDYALHKALGITRSAVSSLRHGGTFSDETAVKVAELLDMHPGIVMLDMHTERAKTPKDQALWKEIFEGFLTLSLRAKSAQGYALLR